MRRIIHGARMERRIPGDSCVGGDGQTKPWMSIYAAAVVEVPPGDELHTDVHINIYIHNVYMTRMISRLDQND